jgi:glutamyl-Q tRNA(Asp) synthetase
MNTDNTAPHVTRFAPSPTGELHLGHAYSAMVADHLGGGYILRIDDIDHTRCRDHFTAGILDDLRWLGLAWTGDLVFQSQRMGAYADALARLQKMDMVYPCYLTRKELSAVLSAPHGTTAPLATDMILPADEMARRAADGTGAAWRLRTDAALAHTGSLHWFDARTGQMVPVDMSAHGDVVVARRDIGTSYHLSVVVDDALDGITLVTRGDDLADSTHVHRVLQALLGLPDPAYLHHNLIASDTGKRLAKRDHATSLTTLRAHGMTANDLVAQMPPLPLLR